jgi:hypothetical protein
LDLQAGQAQNAFYNELEEWLAGQTQLATTQPVHAAAAAAASPAYLHALLERTAERLDEIGWALNATEEGRQKTYTLLENVGTRLNLLADLVHADQALVARLSETEMQMQPLMTRLVDETVKSREYVVTQLQAEFRLLARTLAGGLPPKDG